MVANASAMVKAKQLFREESIRHRLHKTSAEVLLQRSSFMQPLLWMLSVVFLGLLIAINQINYKDTQSARGRVVSSGGEQQLVAPAAGIVSELLASVGDRVEQGQVIALIATDVFDRQGRAIGEGDRALLELEYATAVNQRKHMEQAFSSRQSDLQARLKQHRQIIPEFSKQLGLIEQQIEISASLLGGVETLLDHKSIPKVQAEQQRMAHIALLREQNSLESELQSLHMQLGMAEQELALLAAEKTLELDRVDAQVRALVLKLEQSADQSTLSVLAQRSGVVSSLPILAGEAVQAGQPLIYLQANDRSMLAEIYVTSKVMGKLAPGQEVLLSYDAFDYQSYGRHAGTVIAIETASLDPRKHLLPMTPSGEPLFRVTAALPQHYVEGQDIFPLQPGLLLTADFVLAEMPLTHYIFKPVLGLRGKVS